MGVQISYDIVGAGWAKCTIRVDDACATVTASYLSDALDDLASAVAASLRGIRTRRPRLRKSQGSTAGYSNRSRKGESAFASSSLRRCGAAVRTRMEQSFFTRNVGYALLRVRYCLSYRDWNERTDLQDIERSGSNMTFPSCGWPSYKNYSSDQQIAVLPSS
jgi:hypothetical protein